MKDLEWKEPSAEEIIQNIDRVSKEIWENTKLGHIQNPIFVNPYVFEDLKKRGYISEDGIFIEKRFLKDIQDG